MSPTLQKATYHIPVAWSRSFSHDFHPHSLLFLAFSIRNSTHIMVSSTAYCGVVESHCALAQVFFKPIGQWEYMFVLITSAAGGWSCGCRALSGFVLSILQAYVAHSGRPSIMLMIAEVLKVCVCVCVGVCVCVYQRAKRWRIFLRICAFSVIVALTQSFEWHASCGFSVILEDGNVVFWVGMLLWLREGASYF